MPRVIVVERNPVTDAQRAALDRCLAIRECTLVQTYRGSDREIAVYEASSAEWVRESHRTAGVAFERAWPADLD